MTVVVPARTQQSYRHEAFLWRTHDDFVQGLAPFVTDGLSAGEAVLVAATPEHLQWLRRALGPKAARVQFVDITEVGRNPSRIIPVWHSFIEEWSGAGRPARGIGEPIWPWRGPAELLECQLHEALLNMSVDPRVPFWLMCPYDEGQLEQGVLQEAHRSHPAIVRADSYQGSSDYAGQAHAEALFSADLPEVAGEPAVITLTAIDEAATFVALHAAAADLYFDVVMQLAEVVRRLTAGGLQHGADQVTVRMWNQPESILLEVAYDSRLDDLLVGRRKPVTPMEDPVWHANHSCQLVQLRSNASGTTIRLHADK